MKHPFTTLGVALVAAVILCSQALAVQIDYLGRINDGQPTDAASEVDYITTLMSVAPGGQVVIGTETYTRIGSVVDTSLYEPPSLVDAARFTTASVDATGFDFILAHYGIASLVWITDSEYGSFTPQPTYVKQPLQYTSLYKAAAAPSVPDGGTTMLLLGTGLFGLILVKRKKQ